MTEEEFSSKFDELKQKTIERIDELKERALKSGAIDLEGYEDNYALPKIVMTAICWQLEQDWKPISGNYMEDVENLKLFL